MPNSVEEIVAQGWQKHEADPRGVFETASNAIALLAGPQQLAPLARLIFHAGGEHIGAFAETLEALGRMQSSAGEDAGAKRALAQVEAACHCCLEQEEQAVKLWTEAASGDAAEGAAIEGSARAQAASALAGRGRMAEARRHLRLASELTGSKPTAENPLCRTLAATGNNIAVTLEERSARTSEEDELMLEAALLARKYWEIAGTWLHVERAEYRLAMVHCRLGRPFDALLHAKECLAICEKSKADAGELFFAHEALAKSHLAARELDVARLAVDRMAELLPRIEDAEFRSFCEGELAKLRKLE